MHTYVQKVKGTFYECEDKIRNFLECAFIFFFKLVPIPFRFRLDLFFFVVVLVNLVLTETA